MADQVIVLTDQQAQKQLAEDIKKLRENPPDKSAPGGVFMNANGKGYHDAWGNPVSEKGGRVESADAADIENELAETERKLAELRQRAGVARAQANARIDEEAREQERKLAAGEGDEDETSIKKKSTKKR